MTFEFPGGMQTFYAVLAVAGFAGCAWHLALLRRARASRTWPRAAARVLGAQVARDPEGNADADIRYAYTVAGREYAGARLRFGPVFQRSAIAAGWDVQDYRPGREITVYYNPAAPEQSVIECGVLPSLWLAIVGTGAVGVFGLLKVVLH